MKGLKCSGCKWLLPNSFCGCPNNTEIGNDCYESEENSNTSSKIEDVKREIDNYINSKSKKEIDAEINGLESAFDKLNKYLENATHEELNKDWEKLKQCNGVCSEHVDLYKDGYNDAMEQFIELLTNTANKAGDDACEFVEAYPDVETMDKYEILHTMKDFTEKVLYDIKESIENNKYNY